MNIQWYVITKRDKGKKLLGHTIQNNNVTSCANYRWVEQQPEFSSDQFQSIFCCLMVHCEAFPGNTGNVMAQDETVSLSAVDMSSVVPADGSDTASSPSEDVYSVILDHSYLPTHFGGLTEKALVYVGGFVVRQVMKQLSCSVCHLVSDAVSASFSESYHLLTLKKNGGLMIPAVGTVGPP